MSEHPTLSDPAVTMEIDGDVAHTESYLFAYHRVKGDPQKTREVFGPSYLERSGFDASKAQNDFLFGGRYVDRLEKRGGEWRISRRDYVLDWSHPLPDQPVFDPASAFPLPILEILQSGHEKYRPI